jgi:type I restriction enzyme, S subunit
MKNGWPVVPLDEVLHQRKEFIQIDDTQTYKRCRVQLHAQGVVLRDTVPGLEIKTKKQQVCRAGEFLVAEIDAKHGGYGLVPSELEGAIVSSHYFLFNVDESKLDRKFLGFLCRTQGFAEQVAAQGSTNYAAIRPSHVLAYQMPLPPLREQRRIVARIDSLAAKIAEARKLSRDAEVSAASLAGAAIERVQQRLDGLFPVVRLAECTELITDGDHLTPPFGDAGVKFIFVGNVSSGVLHFSGSKFVTTEYYASLKEYRKPRRGDILFSAVGATLGVPAVVDCDEEFCFQRHIALIRPDTRKVIARYLWHMLRSRRTNSFIWNQTTGSAQPTVPLRAIRQIPVGLPPIAEQGRIVAHLDAVTAKAAALKQLQDHCAAEFEALMPSILERAIAASL